MPEDIEDITDNWFERNRGLLENLSEILGSPVDVAIQRADRIQESIEGLEPIGNFTNEDHKAAALMGRGCRPGEICEILGMDPTHLSILGTKLEFQEIVDQHRIAWVNEQMARIQQRIDTMSIDNPKTALSVMKELRGLMKLRDESLKTKATLQLQAAKLQMEAQKARTSVPGTIVTIEDEEDYVEVPDAIAEEWSPG